jgi:hypothetical protein
LSGLHRVLARRKPPSGADVIRIRLSEKRMDRGAGPAGARKAFRQKGVSVKKSAFPSKQQTRSREAHP